MEGRIEIQGKKGMKMKHMKISSGKSKCSFISACIQVDHTSASGNNAV